MLKRALAAFAQQKMTFAQKRGSLILLLVLIAQLSLADKDKPGESDEHIGLDCSK